MNARKAHHIWIEQCEAAQPIKARFGLTAAFDYLSERSWPVPPRHVRDADRRLILG
jgi:hypothetical protein